MSLLSCVGMRVVYFVVFYLRKIILWWDSLCFVDDCGLEAYFGVVACGDGSGTHGRR